MGRINSKQIMLLLLLSLIISCIMFITPVLIKGKDFAGYDGQFLAIQRFTQGWQGFTGPCFENGRQCVRANDLVNPVVWYPLSLVCSLFNVSFMSGIIAGSILATAFLIFTASISLWILLGKEDFKPPLFFLSSGIALKGLLVIGIIAGFPLALLVSSKESGGWNMLKLYYPLAQGMGIIMITAIIKKKPLIAGLSGFFCGIFHPTILLLYAFTAFVLTISDKSRFKTLVSAGTGAIIAGMLLLSISSSDSLSKYSSGNIITETGSMNILAGLFTVSALFPAVLFISYRFFRKINLRRDEKAGLLVFVIYLMTAFLLSSTGSFVLGMVHFSHLMTLLVFLGTLLACPVFESMKERHQKTAFYAMFLLLILGCAVTLNAEERTAITISPELRSALNYLDSYPKGEVLAPINLNKHVLGYTHHAVLFDYWYAKQTDYDTALKELGQTATTNYPIMKNVPYYVFSDTDIDAPHIRVLYDDGNYRIGRVE